jgi:ubiquitin carboxyl-terminal hydrolase 3
MSTTEEIVNNKPALPCTPEQVSQVAETKPKEDTNTDNLDDTDDEKEVVKFGVSKYKNIMGVTCYMNSILHILQQVPIFTEYITQAKFKDAIMKKIENKVKSDDYPDQDSFHNAKEAALKEFVIFELFRLFKTSLENDDSSITPTSFKVLIGKKNDMWNEYNHQDSQEFFTFLISQLEEEAGMKSTFLPGLNYKDFNSLISMNESIKNIIATDTCNRFQAREYSPLKNLFDGLTETNRKCMCCNTKSVRYEPFVTLALSVPIKTKQDMVKTFDIYECIDHMVSEEQLDADNKMNCEMCGLRNRGHSQCLLWKTPKILVLHIKRFLVNSFGVPTQKITNNVEYPITNLDLEKYFDPTSPFKSSSKYDLVGINIHQAFGYGGNINSGHYTSIVKNIMNNNWYLYNDSNQLKMAYTKEHLQNQNAYMLFYYRHD